MLYIMPMLIVISGWRFLKDLWVVKVSKVLKVFRGLWDQQDLKVYKVLKELKVFKVRLAQIQV